MFGAVLLAVALGMSAYVAAERTGRSPSVWLIVVALTVLASDYAASLVAAGLAGSNTIFSDSGQAVVLAAVLAAPLVGLAAGGGLVAWVVLRPGAVCSFSKPVRMYGGFDDTISAELLVHVENGALIVRGVREQQRFEQSDLENTTMDGEYVVIHTAEKPGPLMLRARNDGPNGRERRVAIARALVRRLRECRSSETPTSTAPHAQ
ncbi:MAG: hypothetical protein KUG77_28775 [Nannocystaceae bacterium]|nr:hypothetical protein [Nannocystaceae bacterium]